MNNRWGADRHQVVKVDAVDDLHFGHGPGFDLSHRSPQSLELAAEEIPIDSGQATDGYDASMTQTLELPQTAGCLVCGRDNPIGLKLRLRVSTESGVITTDFTPGPHHIGFAGLIHGGVLATVVDEAMVWAAIWSTRRACVAAEMTVRFKQKVAVGHPLKVEAKITRARARLVETESVITDGQTIFATATAKYVPLDVTATAEFVATFVARAETNAAAQFLRNEAE